MQQQRGVLSSRTDQLSLWSNNSFMSAFGFSHMFWSLSCWLATTLAALHCKLWHVLHTDVVLTSCVSFGCIPHQADTGLQMHAMQSMLCNSIPYSESCLSHISSLTADKHTFQQYMLNSDRVANLLTLDSTGSCQGRCPCQASTAPSSAAASQSTHPKLLPHAALPCCH